MVAIGTELRRLRERHSLTQADLAKATNVSRSHLCQVELGRTWASADFLGRCEEVFAEPGRLLAMLRSAKVPQSATSVGDGFLDAVSHKFVPVKLPAGATLGPSAVPIEIEGLDVQRFEVSDGEHVGTGYLFPFGVVVLHLREEQRFPNVAGLAMWRQHTYPLARQWTRSMLMEHLRSDGITVADVDPSYVLSLYEVTALPWQHQDDHHVGMRLLSVPSMLLDRRDVQDFSTVSRAEEAERELLRQGFDHPEIVDFGIKGVSIGYASWSGVTYHATSPSRALADVDLVQWELIVQALWCYCDSIVQAYHRGLPTAHENGFDSAFLRRMKTRLQVGHAREHLQQRLMKDAILSTSRLLRLLDQTQEALADSPAQSTKEQPA